MAGRLNITIEKNAKFRKRLRYLSKTKRPINLTGYVAKLQARSAEGDAIVLLELSTENGGITLDALGYITLNLTLAQVVALTFITALYDLILTPPGGEPDRLLQGRLTISIGITQ